MRLPHIRAHRLVQDKVKLLELLWLVEPCLSLEGHDDEVDRELDDDKLVVVVAELVKGGLVDLHVLGKVAR